MNFLHALDCARPAKRPPWIAHPLLAALLWAATSIGASYSLRGFSFGASARLALATVPMAGFLYFVWSQVVWFSQSDELQQRIQLTVWVHAFVCSMMGAIGLHYLQKAGFFPAAQYPNLEYYGDVLPYAFVAGMLLGYARATWRYL